jgi:hypothetical protein
MLAGRGRIAPTIYGTVVVMATIAGESELADTSTWRLGALVTMTVLVIWLAHMYADYIADCIKHGRLLDRYQTRDVIGRELPIALAAIWPVAALLAGALGLLSKDNAVDLALGIGLLALAAQGIRFAQAQRLSGLGSFIAVSINLMLGLAVVALKTFIAHH